MDINNTKISDALEQCEQIIRDLIAAAAQAGDYNSVQRGREVALGLRALRSDSECTTLQRKESEASANTKPASTTKIRRTRSAKSSKYPKFEIKGNYLIRYGWSKKEKREYNHKVPKVAFDQVIYAMNQISTTDTEPHTAEAIIEQANEKLDEPIPNYQIYAILAYLRTKNTIRKHGREGYLILPNFSELTQGTWNR